MKSEEINKIIHSWDSKDMPYEAFGGKAIPYIGWFWRTVNFDSEAYYFGVLPEYKGLDRNDKVRLGFMENNKWDYDYCFCPSIDWHEIKQLIEEAVKNPTHDTLKAVDDKIQSLLTTT